MSMITLNEKEAELKALFEKEQKDALSIEEEIKRLQALHQEKIVNMTRLQGAFSLLKDLKTEEEEETAVKEKKEEEKKS